MGGAKTYTNAVDIWSIGCNFGELFNKMLTFDPNKRATAVNSLQHHYFTDAPAPMEPQWMPTWREHRNEAENPRNCGARRHVEQLTLGSRRQAPRSAIFGAAKKLRTSVF